jgi:RNA polymerase sigma-70 factor (ECF subfamily)
MITTSTQKNNLLKDCINGNRKSQKELYDLLSPSMYSICLRYAKNQMDAEDILQNGFIKLFNNLHKFRGDGPFEGWVRRIFVNSAIELLRDKKHHIPVDLLSEHYTPVTQNLPLDNLYKKDLLKTTHLLSDGYRTVFHLYAIEGLSHKEIAEQIGISESTSKSQYSRAKAILRNLLANKKPHKPKVGFAA